jgi:hypothetical protein
LTIAQNLSIPISATKTTPLKGLLSRDGGYVKFELLKPWFMKNILIYIATLPAFLLSSSTSLAQNKPRLEGVWKITEVMVTYSNTAGKDSTITVNNPQPGLTIFTKGYYSVMAVRGSQPRAAVDPPKDPNNLTDAEKIARFTQWRTLTANSGTYEIKGSTILRHPIVAKNVDVMTQETATIYEFKLEGDNTLWLSAPRSTTEPGLKAKWTRVE